MYSVETTEQGQAVKGDFFDRLKVIKITAFMYSVFVLLSVTLYYYYMKIHV